MSGDHRSDWLGEADDGVRIQLRVAPRASKNAIEPADARGLRVRVTAAPDDGKANVAVVKLLAKRLGVAASAVAIIRGETARDKVVEVRGLTIEEVRDALAT